MSELHRDPANCDQSRCSPVRLWRVLLLSALVSMLGTAAIADTELAVINSDGTVWARDLTSTSVGLGHKLNGNLFGGPGDQFVYGSANNISVVTRFPGGNVWFHQVGEDYICCGNEAPGSIFGGPDAKYVLYDEGYHIIYVINTKGQVWAHDFPNLGVGIQLMGPSLFGAPNDKYAVFDHDRILIINTAGQVWAHDLYASGGCPPQTLVCPAPDSITGGYLLSGPSLFGGPNDKYVALAGNQLLVINSFGQVWARTISHNSVTAGHLLPGPGLFGGPGDKYVVVYDLPWIQ